MVSRRGHSTDKTRVPGQKVRIYRSGHWIALNFFHEFSDAVFDGVAWNKYNTSTVSERGHSTDKTRVPDQKVRIYRSGRWIALKVFQEFLEAICNGVAWNHYDTATTSDRGLTTNTSRVPV